MTDKSWRGLAAPWGLGHYAAIVLNRKAEPDPEGDWTGTYCALGQTAHTWSLSPTCMEGRAWSLGKMVEQTRKEDK